MTGAILVGFALLAIGATGGFLVALGARRMTRPRPARSASKRVGSVVVEESEESVPSLVPHQQPPPRPQYDLDEALTPMPIPPYDPDAECEDDVPTTLYRHQDEDLEAMLGELDTSHDHR